MGKRYYRKVLTVLVSALVFFSCEKHPLPNIGPSRKDDPDKPVTPQENPAGGLDGHTADIYLDSLYARRTRYFFYDLKGEPAGLTSNATACYVFKEIGMNGIRIPIYGDNANGGHTAQGIVGDGTYSKILASIRNSWNHVPKDSLIIFAGKKLDGTTSFPSWVMDAGKVNVSRYSSMLMDYLRYMKSEGIEIDVLGIDNELNFNEGGIEPEVFHQIVGALKDSCGIQGIKTPRFIGPELFVTPAAFATSWIHRFYEAGYQEDLDIYGTHYYPQHHTPTFRASLQHEIELVNSDRHREFWATEPHWDNNDEAKADMLAHAEYAMCAIFDQTDVGMDMFCWWAFKYEGSLRAVLMDRLSKAVFRSQPVRMIDHDGEDTMVMGRLQSRAYLREDGVLSIFLLNLGEEDYPGYGLVLHGGGMPLGSAVGAGSVNAVQWRDDTPYAGSRLDTEWRSDTLCMRLPSRSITEVVLAPR